VPRHKKTQELERAIRKKKRETALAILNSPALAGHPEWWLAYNRGRIEWAARNLMEAKEWLLRAEPKGPTYEISLALARVNHNLGSINEAIEWSKKALAHAATAKERDEALICRAGVMWAPGFRLQSLKAIWKAISKR